MEKEKQCSELTYELAIAGALIQTDLFSRFDEDFPIVFIFQLPLLPTPAPDSRLTCEPIAAFMSHTVGPT